MRNILIKMAILGKKATEKDIKNGLRDICEETHDGCNLVCPVYELQTEEERKAAHCLCFKNEMIMLKFIKQRMGIE